MKPDVVAPQCARWGFLIPASARAVSRNLGVDDEQPGLEGVLRGGELVGVSGLRGESGGDRMAEPGLRFIAYLHIFAESPATFHKIQRLYKGRVCGAMRRRATLRRHFIPLNFRDKDSAASSGDDGLPFPLLAFISPRILNREDRFKRMEFPCDRAR